jgi:hypothetical protein
MEPRSHRVYANTVAHKIITGCFLVVIILQLGPRAPMTYLAAEHPGACHSFGYVTQPALYFGTLSRHLWHLWQMWGYSLSSRTARFAPPISLQDNAYSTDHSKGRGPSRPSSVHFPHPLRVLDGLGLCMYDANLSVTCDTGIGTPPRT